MHVFDGKNWIFFFEFPIFGYCLLPDVPETLYTEQDSQPCDSSGAQKQ